MILVPAIPPAQRLMAWHDRVLYVKVEFKASQVGSLYKVKGQLVVVGREEGRMASKRIDVVLTGSVQEVKPQISVVEFNSRWIRFGQEFDGRVSGLGFLTKNKSYCYHKVSLSQDAINSGWSPDGVVIEFAFNGMAECSGDVNCPDPAHPFMLGAKETKVRVVYYDNSPGMVSARVYGNMKHSGGSTFKLNVNHNWEQMNKDSKSYGDKSGF